MAAYGGGKQRCPLTLVGRWGNDLSDPAKRQVDGLMKGRLAGGATGRQRSRVRNIGSDRGDN
jgi:hypothetical protein